MEFDAALESSEDGIADLLSLDDQWMIGSDIMVKPVTKPGEANVDVYFPSTAPIHFSENGLTMDDASHTIWYDLITYQAYDGTKQHIQTVASPIDKLPVFIRSGSIIPRKMRLRRSTVSMKNDPYTLIVTLDTSGSYSSGSLYMDDEETFDYYHKGDYSIRSFAFKNGELTSTQVDGKDDIQLNQEIERIVVVGISRTTSLPKKALLSKKTGDSSQIELEIVPVSVDKSSTLVYQIRKPGIQVNEDWSISFIYDL